jgi:hypothetical protein
MKIKQRKSYAVINKLYFRIPKIHNRLLVKQKKKTTHQNIMQ